MDRGYLVVLVIGLLLGGIVAACNEMNDDDCEPRTHPDGTRTTCIVVVR
jgi:hypothetical protein